MRHLPKSSEFFLELPFHPSQTVARKLLATQVNLEIELSEFGRPIRFLRTLQNCQCREARPPGAIDEKQLLLGADPPHTRFQLPVLVHPFKGVDVPQELSQEDTGVRTLLLLLDVLFAHLSAQEK
jgi:hypothetical protein